MPGPGDEVDEDRPSCADVTDTAEGLVPGLGTGWRAGRKRRVTWRLSRWRTEPSAHFSDPHDRGLAELLPEAAEGGLNGNVSLTVIHFLKCTHSPYLLIPPRRLKFGIS